MHHLKINFERIIFVIKKKGNFYIYEERKRLMIK